MCSALLTFGVRESTRFNNIFTVCNVAVVAFVIICGCFKSIFKASIYSKIDCLALICLFVS